MIYITYTMCMYIYILLPLPLKSFAGLDDCKIKEQLQHNEKHHLGFVEHWGLFFFKDYTETFTTYSIWGLRFNPGLQWDKSSLLLMDEKFVTPHVWTQYLLHYVITGVYNKQEPFIHQPRFHRRSEGLSFSQTAQETFQRAWRKKHPLYL